MDKLKQELKALNKRRQEIQQQIRDEVSKKALPDFEKLVGRYFKFRNAYSSKKEWFEYLQVTGIVNDSIGLNYNDEPSCEVNCIRFAKDSDNKISFEMNNTMYHHHIGEEISEKEFRYKYEELIKEIFI